MNATNSFARRVCLQFQPRSVWGAIFLSSVLTGCGGDTPSATSPSATSPSRDAVATSPTAESTSPATDIAESSSLETATASQPVQTVVPPGTPQGSPEPSTKTPPTPGPQVDHQASASSATRLATSEPVPATAAPAKNIVQFEVLPTDEGVTSYAVMEDNRQLILTHQAANRISIWDTRTRTRIAAVETLSPRSVLCRGERVFVANDREGTISVFARDKNWALVNQLEVEKPHIVHLAAPQGRNFQNEILVTCHGDGPQASYQSCFVYHLDVAKDKDRLIGKSSLASCSYDGRLATTQGSFNLSPSGEISAFAWRDFTTGRKSEPVFRAGIQQTPYVFQVQSGSFWFGNNIVFGGLPLRTLKKDMGLVVVPDRTRKLVYALSGDRLRVHRLDVTLEEVADRKLELPVSDATKVYHNIYRIREYLLDHPIAFTDEDTLRLFMINIGNGVMLAAETSAFAGPAAEETPAVVGNAGTTADPVAPASTTVVASANPDNLGLPDRIAEGRPFSHKLPPKADTTYELMGALSGMQLVGGVLSWTPGKEHVGVQELKIKVTSGGSVSFKRPTLEVISRELIEQAGSLAKVGQAARLILEPDVYRLSAAPGYQSLLLLQGDLVKRLTEDGLHVVKEYRLPGRYKQIDERDGQFLALSSDPQQLDVIDPRTLKVVRSIPLKATGVRVLELMDLAAHPKMPISYVAVKHDIQPPRYRVLIVDETKRSVTAPEEVLGTWVCVDPAGRSLYTGYKDIYQKGSHFHLNPGWRLLEVPDYGNIDMLISYDLRNGEPIPRQVVTNAGGNGYGIRLSPDGSRVTYLSHVGYPLHSQNLVSWQATNFKRDPVTYETKGRGTTTELAYHPTLNLAAVPGGNSAVVFDRETGKVDEGKLLLPADGLGGAKVEQLMFSPNGQALVFVCNDAAIGRYLQSVPLRLDTQDRQRVAKSVEQPEPLPVAGRNLETVKRSELQAVATNRRAKVMSPQDIARQFNDSVVLIGSSDSSATGFVVGRRGYILTCAHAIPNSGASSVSYTIDVRGDSKVMEAEATIVRIDHDLDLALLKIGPAKLLTPVSLTDRAGVESGEQVTVIGNPGAGSTVLTHTLTTGVVSNPARELNGQSVMQISAAVNPGNSGGPVFDHQGRVIGLVSMKARLEGAGFAIPVGQLRQFLEAATSTGETER